MTRVAKNPQRCAAQLRVMLRRWQLRIGWGVGFAALSGAGLLVCWWFDAHPLMWLLCGLSLLSAGIGIGADINALHTTRNRIAEIEQGST